jgi:phenylalanyl-tRNA synthetase alpha chain
MGDTETGPGGISLEYLDALEREAVTELQGIDNEDAAEAFRVKYLGKKGAVKNALKGLGAVPEQQRREIGARANAVSRALEELFGKKPWKTAAAAGIGGGFDPTLPGFPFPQGSLHPLLTIRSEICAIFTSMGFDIAYGPEVETDYYNFEALNHPPHHPARDMQDTFYVSDTVLLRTHTSPVQIRVMESRKPPIRCIMPGRVYRNEEISARSYCLFHQVEGLYIDENVGFADLKGTLLAFCKRFFGADAKIKIRPSYFPFTEPSIEVDVSCFLCGGAGCRVCKQTGWLEILGAGMVHPKVLEAGAIDSEKYTGFAFGMGIERIALLKYDINDIRLFFENDVRFLRQF